MQRQLQYSLFQQSRQSQQSKTVVRHNPKGYIVRRKKIEGFQSYLQRTSYEDALLRLPSGSHGFPIKIADQISLIRRHNKDAPSDVWKLARERSIDFIDLFADKRPSLKRTILIEMRVTSEWLNSVTSTSVQQPCDVSKAVQRDNLVHVEKVKAAHEQQTLPSQETSEQVEQNEQVEQGYEPDILNHRNFRFAEPIVEKRKELVMCLWDCREVLLDAREGSCNYDIPKLENVTLSAVHSQGDFHTIRLTRRLDKASLTVDAGRANHYLACHRNGQGETFDLANLLPDYQKNYWHYFGGAWFEEFVYHTLKANRTVQKLALRYYALVHGVAREIDVIAFSSGCYYLISCKTGNPQREDIVNLEKKVNALNCYVRSHNGRHHRCKGILCYARDVNLHVSFRHCNLSCVSGGSLGEILRDRLIDLQPGVVYK
ncbi:MAG: hypothetical protein Q4G03_11040 [Planctomycetia bacterium]|nr:hypothetical protein [Planctomycetia bacterium]